jgi:anaerobic magnesium-protoporphyrin IX monomethyl ester cyclase
MPGRILLIYPPSQTQGHSNCPMGMMMLGAVLESAGYEVHLLDANAARRRRTSAEIVNLANQMRPDVIGMTLVTPLVKEAYRLASALRSCGAKLIAGGPHATLLPEEPLAYGFNASVVGEGEPTIVEAVEAVLGTRPMESVLGLVYRRSDGQTARNDPRPLVNDLDALPPPARHLVNAADFGPAENVDLHDRIFTSRGCPARCAFCAGGLFGKRFRFRSADGVVDELVATHREYGTRHFHFVDDAMTMDKARARRICQRMIEQRLGFTWNMMTRLDTMDEEMLNLAASAGCVQIEYGVESGDSETLKRIHKPHTPETVRRIVPLTKQCGIRPVVFFILGFPWEDGPAIDRTRQLMEDLAPHVVFHPAIASVLIPFPGTEIYDRYKDEYGFAGWWTSEDRSYDAPRPETHPFYQRVLYPLGMVLDADFFRYPAEIKAKVHDIFRFMYASNLRDRGVLYRTASLLAIDSSRKLDAISPRLERWVFRRLLKLWRTLH